MHHIHANNHVVEKYMEFDKPVYIVFIDCKKALASVDTTAKLEAFELRNREVYKTIGGNNAKPERVWVTLRENSVKFPIRTGLWQGEAVSLDLLTNSLYRQGIQQHE